MIQKCNILIPFILLCVQLQAQQVSGCFPAYAGQEVSLSVYKGFAAEEVAQATAGSGGKFTLPYPSDYTGAAFLRFGSAGGIEVLLNSGQQSFEVRGTSLMDVDSLQCEGNVQTQTLYTYYKDQQSRERALMGWKYLGKTYRDVPYLRKQKEGKLISREIRELEKEKESFIRHQGKESYLGWYLPLVSQVRDIPVSVQRYPERIPEHIRFFMHTDFSDERFYHSGLLPVLMDNYYFMLENMGKTMDSMYVEMNRATDYVLGNLEAKKPEWVEGAAVYLFKLFEKRSLFAAAEHLSLAVLDQPNVQLSSDARNRFEGYRAMKRGNRAPDIDFTEAGNEKKYLKGYTSLSGMGGKYKLVIFGESGCAECRSQIEKIRQMYPALQEHGIEVVYVSLDTDRKEFEQAAEGYPWAGYFDGKGWDSRPVKDYHVFASPTVYLLGEGLDILYKVVSPAHLEAIVKELK